MKKEKDSLVMDYLFSVIMALVLLCSQNFIDIPNFLCKCMADVVNYSK